MRPVDRTGPPAVRPASRPYAVPPGERGVVRIATGPIDLRSDTVTRPSARPGRSKLTEFQDGMPDGCNRVR